MLVRAFLAEALDAVTNETARARAGRAVEALVGEAGRMNVTTTARHCWTSRASARISRS